MNFRQLIVDAKSLIGPSCEVTDTTIGEWVNEYYMMIVDEINKVAPDYFSKVVKASTVASQKEYALPLDFSAMISVKLDGVRCLNWNRFAESEEIKNTYYLRGRTFGFPIVPSENGDLNIELVYQSHQDELIEDTDVPALPPNFQRLLKHGVYSNYLAQDDEPSASSQRYQIFKDRLDNALATLIDRNEDQPQGVQDNG